MVCHFLSNLIAGPINQKTTPYSPDTAFIRECTHLRHKDLSVIVGLWASEDMPVDRIHGTLAPESLFFLSRLSNTTFRLGR